MGAGTHGGSLGIAVSSQSSLCRTIQNQIRPKEEKAESTTSMDSLNEETDSKRQPTISLLPYRNGCGSSLIHSDILLSAAYCNQIIFGFTLTVFIGCTTLHLQRPVVWSNPGLEQRQKRAQGCSECGRLGGIRSSTKGCQWLGSIRSR